MKMISAVWFLSWLALLLVDVRTGASQQKDVIPQRCYQCLSFADKTSRCEETGNILQITCPVETPYCATTAQSPHFASSLTCAVGGQTPCTLIYKGKDIYVITCTCTGRLCNAPFRQEFRNELLNFSSTDLPDNTTTGMTELFINSTAFAKVAAANLYESITLTISEVTLTPSLTTLTVSSTMSPNIFVNANAPRAEALKQEATVPPDDDEDESEGSGSFQDVNQKIPAAPAAPSSFLPENENKAIPVHINFLVTAPSLLLYVLA